MSLYEKLLREKHQIGKGPVARSLTEYLGRTPSKGHAVRQASMRRKRRDLGR